MHKSCFSTSHPICEHSLPSLDTDITGFQNIHIQSKGALKQNMPAISFDKEKKMG
jgi:hypothetical protein